MEQLKKVLSQGNEIIVYTVLITDVLFSMYSRTAETQLVDLFSPEFNLKIGDIFSKSGGQSKVLSEDESENYSEKLRRIVTERMETDTIQ